MTIKVTNYSPPARGTGRYVNSPNYNQANAEWLEAALKDYIAGGRIGARWNHHVLNMNIQSLVNKLYAARAYIIANWPPGEILDLAKNMKLIRRPQGLELAEVRREYLEVEKAEQLDDLHLFVEQIKPEEIVMDDILKQFTEFCRAPYNPNENYWSHSAHGFDQYMRAKFFQLGADHNVVVAIKDGKIVAVKLK